MLKYIPELKGKSQQAMLQDFESFLQQPKPRKIPEPLVASCVPAILIVGQILASIGLILTVILLVLFVIFLPLKFILTCTTLPLLAIIGLILVIWGLAIKNKRLKILRDGDLYEGDIVRIVPAAGTVNGKTFFKVQAQFKNAQGILTDGSDLVRSDIAENFFTIKDSETSRIDLLHVASVPKMVILPLKIIYMNKYN